MHNVHVRKPTIIFSWGDLYRLQLFGMVLQHVARDEVLTDHLYQTFQKSTTCTCIFHCTCMYMYTFILYTHNMDVPYMWLFSLSRLHLKCHYCCRGVYKVDIKAILIMGCSYFGQQTNKEVSNHASSWSYTSTCTCTYMWPSTTKPTIFTNIAEIRVIISNFHSTQIDRRTIPLHKNMLCSF